ncbi:transposase [Streptomyces broussonetiae]|uniref:transposase n=1 Tax=Streptomyces broussonetiae TaxID=2686304 RepID=UPI0035D7B6F6
MSARQRANHRTRSAGIPEAVQFATKPRLAAKMIEAALDAGITASWVTGDEAYGRDPQLRAALQARRIGEDKSDRRINVLGALVVGADPDLWWEHTPGEIDAAVLLEFVCCRLAGLPGEAAAPAPAADGVGPRTACLATVETVHRGAGQRLRAPGQGFQGPPRAAGEDPGGAVLPAAPQPRSPELNDIEGSAANFTRTA